MRIEQAVYAQTIEQEDRLENPRAQENLGTMMVWHEEYQLFENPNQIVYKTLAEFRKNFLFKQRNNVARVIALGLFYYERTGRLSTSPMDGGIAIKVGYIYTDADAIKKRFDVDSGRKPFEINREAKMTLREEVEAHSNHVVSRNLKKHGMEANEREIFSAK